jgi:hypothetical protein
MAHSQKSSDYIRTALPAQAKTGGEAWADKFAHLPAEERRMRMMQLVAGSVRARARKAGFPDPVIIEAQFKPAPGGGYVVDDGVPAVPLRPEYGGDGRTPDDALAEARAAVLADGVRRAGERIDPAKAASLADDIRRVMSLGPDGRRAKRAARGG